MSGNQRLKTPREGGDLTWDDKNRRYRYRNAVPFVWVFTDDFDERTMYLPLSVLPAKPR
jgi:hypothetical protein